MKTLSRTTRPVTLCIAVVAALSLSACGGASEEPETQDSAVAGESAEHNEADVRFASEMIPHHAQALMMTDMAVGRELDKELGTLVDEIRAAQAPEIELMVDWLQEWGEPVPETVRDHAHGGHDGDGGEMPEMAEMPEMPEMAEMPGMMTEEQLAELEDARGAEFEELWLAMMVEHHEGAVEMAETELDEGAYEPALDLAEEIASSQTEEIERMQEMLEG